MPKPSASLHLTLRQGVVFYLQHRGLTSPLPHYCIVLNVDPLSGEALLLAVATSQVDAVHQRRAQLPPETIVEVAPAAYPVFTKPTAIDCNDVKTLPLADLRTAIDSRRAQEKDPLPAAILQAILAGVLASPMVDNATKRQVAVRK